MLIITSFVLMSKYITLSAYKQYYHFDIECLGGSVV